MFKVLTLLLLLLTGLKFCYGQSKIEKDVIIADEKFRISSTALTSEVYQICVARFEEDSNGKITLTETNCDVIKGLDNAVSIDRIVTLFKVESNESFSITNKDLISGIIKNLNLNSSQLIAKPSKRAFVLNTNISLPIIRYNVMLKDQRIDNKFGNVNFFNSAGAGISINFGNYIEYINNADEAKQVDKKFTNVIGLQVGVLFAANSTTGSNNNIFAPFFGLVVLDFHVGYGVELGTVDGKTQPGFWVVSYGIPLQKITDAGAVMLSRSKKKSNDTNPPKNRVINKRPMNIW